MAKGYGDAGASITRRALKGFLAQSGSPIEDIDWNNYTLRQRSRMLYMASPVATAAINTNRTKVVGVGLSLKSIIDREILGMSQEAAKEWQKKTEAEFSLWASRKQNCDAIGMNNFASMQQLAIKSWLMSGDVFPLFKRYKPTPLNPYTLRIHLIEADRVSTPSDFSSGIISLALTTGVNPKTKNKVYDGVEVNENGEVVAYHIRSTHPYQAISEQPKWTRVEAYGKKTGLPNILHISDSERPDQYRGVSYLAQIIEPLLQLRRYTESEIMAAMIQSFFSAWIKTESDVDKIPMNEVGDGDVAGVPSENPEDVSKSDNEYEMGPGSVLHLAENEDVIFGNPNIPVANFDNFVKTFCKMIGAALELPYDVLIKEYNSSFSAARGALMDAWDAFKMRRTWFIDDFCQPVYEVWLAEAVAIGRVKAPGFFIDPLIRDAWCCARWIGPVQGQLDPTKEVKAAIMNVDRAFKTHEQVTREMGGGDWEENVEQLKAENESLKEAGGGTYMASLADHESENQNGEGD